MTDGSITISTKLDGSNITAGLKRIKDALFGTAQAAQSQGSKMSASFINAKAKVSELEYELEKLDAKRDAIAAKKTDELAGIPYSKEEMYEAVDAALAADKEYIKLGNTIERTGEKLNGYKAKMNAAKTASEEKAKATNKVTDAHKKAKKSIEGTKKATTSTTKSMKDMVKQSVPLAKQVLRLGNMFKLMVLRMVMRKAFNAIKAGFNDLVKVNANFNASMSAISSAFLQARNALATAFAPVLQALTPIIVNITNAFITAMNAVSAFTARLFGGATKYTKAVKTQVDYADALDKTAKAAGNLASIDEINIIGTDDAASGPSPSEMFEEVEVPEEVIGFIDRLKTALEPALTSLSGLWDALSPMKDFVSQGLIDFYNMFLVPVGTWVLGEAFPHLVNTLKDGLAKINWDKLNTALKNLWDKLTPFAINVGTGLLWFWDNVLVPLGVYVVNEVVPVFLDLLSAAIGALDTVIQIMKPMGEWFWDNILVPFGEWTGGIIVSVLEGLTKALKLFSTWAKDNERVVEAVTTVILVFLAGLLAYLVVHKIHILITTKLAPAFTTLAASFAAVGWPVILLVIGIGLLVAGILLLAKNWDKMTPAQKAITILTALAAAGIAAAIAFALFHTTWTAGLAAIAIAAGIAVIAGTVLFSKDKMPSMSGSGASISDATSFASSFAGGSPLPQLARGGIVDAPTTAIIGERGREAVLPLESNTGWMDILADRIAGRIGVTTAEAGGGGTVTIPIYLDGVLTDEYIVDAQERIAVRSNGRRR